MRRGAGAILLCAGLLLLGAVPTPAQPASGDLVLADASSLVLGTVLCRQPGGAVSTVYGGFPGYFPNWISMTADNSSLLVPFVNSQTLDTGFVAQVSPAGVLGVLKTLGNDIRFSNGHELDGDGTFLHAGQAGVLFRLDPVRLILSTLTKTAPALNGVAVDRDDGSCLGVIFPVSGPVHAGSLVRFEPATAALTTLLAADPRISRPSGLLHDPATGDLIVARFDAPGVVRVNAATLAVTTLWTQPDVNAIAPTPRGTFLVATPTDAREIDAGGTVLRTMIFPALLYLTGIAEYGDRRIAMQGAALPGRTVQVEIHTARSSDAHRVYVLAASLATRPDAAGPFATGERVNLAADALFFASLTGTLGSIFRGFVGTLDGQAQAQASVHIPATVPAGLNLPIHIGGIVLAPGTPGGVSTVLPSATFVLR
ncbi:MAG: hypothetical protein JXQ29_10190 [Planctomycetes bacterium]|nr:hypothetical protein [Planctomycetota bacterium]